MATGKRYYWIKLKETFMTSDAVDFLMGQPDGANYVVLYQMLCLKTINTGGKLERHIGEVIIPYDEAKIQRDCKWFSIDTVRVALNLYKALGLVYADKDGALCLTDHENLVGSETDYAQKNRRMRAQQQALPAGHNVSPDVSEDVSTDIEIDMRDRDKSLETDIEKDIEIEDENDMPPEEVENVPPPPREEIPSGEGICRTKDVRRIISEWNKLGLTQIRRIDPDSNRGKMLRRRVKDYGVEDVVLAIRRISVSDFLLGRNGSGWAATFDWFIKPNNFCKVLEGNYDNRDKPDLTPQRQSQGKDAVSDLVDLHRRYQEQQ